MRGRPFIRRMSPSPPILISPSPLTPLAVLRMARVTALELFLQIGIFRHSLLMAAHAGLFGLLVVHGEVVAVLALVLLVHVVVAALGGAADIDVAFHGLVVANAQSVLAWALWVKITCFFSLPVLFMVMGFSI